MHEREHKESSTFLRWIICSSPLNDICLYLKQKKSLESPQEGAWSLCSRSCIVPFGGYAIIKLSNKTKKDLLYRTHLKFNWSNLVVSAIINLSNKTMTGLYVKYTWNLSILKNLKKVLNWCSNFESFTV